MKQKVKDYLIENNLTDVNKVVAHIEELKASKGLPIEKKQMMFELIYYIYNDSSSLDSFFAGEALKRSADYKIVGETKFYDPQNMLGNYIKVVRENEQLDDTKNTIISTQNHTPTNIIRILEAVDLQEINKILEDINTVVDMSLTISDDGVTLSAPKENKNEGMTFLDEAIELSAEKENKGHSTRHKSKHGESHKEVVFKDNPHLGTIQERLDLAGKFKKEALDAMYFKNTHFVRQEEQTKQDSSSFPWQPTEGRIIDFSLGKKETKGKLYYEISWEFIEEMAKRMANNKSDKYPLYNWKKNIDVEDLKQAINRHHIEVMKGNYKDGEEVLGHIVSYACNSMMLWEQLNKS